MSFTVLLIFFFIIFFTYLVHSALVREEIIGGNIVQHTFPNFQAAIVGKQNFSNYVSLYCGAGIINENFVLSAAHCFLESPGVLSEASFSVVVGSINLRTFYDAIIPVERIYTAIYELDFSLNDIAVVQLNQTLNLNYNPFLSRLYLPVPDQIFQGRGIIFGFGSYEMQFTYSPVTGLENNTNSFIDLVLRYGYSLIMSDEECLRYHHLFTPSIQFCSSMVPNRPTEEAGICSGDSGGPLVINNIAVGIASRSPLNCDDSLFGSIYVKVSAYVHFIQSILSGNIHNAYPLYIYENLPHREN